MSKLVFIKNNEQLNLLQQYNPTLISGVNVILTTSLIEWIKVRELCNNKLLYAGDYIDGRDFIEIADEANFLCASWYKSVDGLLNYRGINLAEIVRILNLNFFREVLAMTLVTQRIMSEFTINEVIIFNDLATSCIGRSAYDNTHSTPEAVIMWEADKRNINKKILKLRRGDLKNSIPYKIIRKFRGGIKRIKTNTLNRRKQNINPDYSQSLKNKRILGFGHSYDLLIVSAIVHEWNKAANSEGILFNLGGTIDLNEIRSRSGLVEYNELSCFSLKDVYITKRHNGNKKKIGNVQKKWMSYRKELDSSNPIANPYIDFQWKYIWDEINKLTFRVDYANNILEELRPDVVITSDWGSPFPRTIVEVAHQKGILTVGTPHGWIGIIDSFEPFTDVILTWGELSKNQLEKKFYGANTSFIISGSPVPEAAIGSIAKGQKDTLSKLFGIDDKKQTILLLTGRDDTGALSQLQSNAFQLIWEKWIEFARLNEDIQIVIKPHPSIDFYEYYKELTDCIISDNLFLIEDDKLEDVLPLVNLSVLVESFTTAGYICMATGIPVLVSHYTLKYLRETDEPWVNGLSISDNMDDFFRKLKSFLYDSNCRAEHIKRQNIFLKSCLSITNVPSAKRAVNIIKERL